jgi:hypothetical protein
LGDLIAVFDAAVTARERIRVLVRVRQFDGVTLEALRNEALRSVKMRGLKQVERHAPVGGPDWMTTTAQWVSPLARVETRHFAEAEEEQAWAWLEARPVP